MKKRFLRIPFLLLGIMAVLLMAGCALRIGDFEVQVGDIDRVEVGEMQRKTDTIPLDELDWARVEVRMAAGDFTLSGGARDLMQAEYEYNVEAWEPEVEYRQEAGVGTLRVEQPINVTISGAGARNAWDIRLTDEVPLDLSVRLGAGDAVLDLRGMNLRQLSFQMGAGDLSIDLSGDWPQDFSVDIERGVGEASIKLPGEVGVRVSTTSAVGETIIQGLEQQGEYFVNQAYGVSEVTIDIDVLGAVGRLRLEVQE